MSDVPQERMPLEDFLKLAYERGASTVLYLVGRPPVMRIGRELQPPLEDRPLTFRETEKLVERLLSPQEIIRMNENGNIETRFNIGNITGNLTVFYGLGSHNLVFYLDRGKAT